MNKPYFQFRGLLKSLFINNTECVLPILNLESCTVTVYLKNLRLNIKQPWYFRFKELNSPKLGYFTSINSIYDVQELLEDHLSVLMVGKRLFVKNKTPVSCIFNKSFKTYCGLSRLQPGEEKCISFKKDHYKILYYDEEILNTLYTPIINDTVYFDSYLSVNLSFKNILTDQIVQLEDIGNESYLDIYIYFIDCEGQKTTICIG